MLCYYFRNLFNSFLSFSFLLIILLLDYILFYILSVTIEHKAPQSIQYIVIRDYLTFNSSMHPRMPRQIFTPVEGLIASRTRHRLLPHVHELNMRRQPYPPIESSIAMRTNVRIFSSVMENMSPQLSSLDEPASAIITTVRLFTSVGLLVPVQSLLRSEPSLALLALIRFFPRMHTSVLFHCAGRWKPLVAHIACVRPLARMRPQMDVKQC